MPPCEGPAIAGPANESVTEFEGAVGPGRPDAARVGSPIRRLAPAPARQVLILESEVSRRKAWVGSSWAGPHGPSAGQARWTGDVRSAAYGKLTRFVT
jgi:hypothetical protein